MVVPAALDEAQQAMQAGHWLWTVSEWLRTFLKVTGPLLLLISLLVSLRCRMLPKIHKLQHRLMKFILREEPRGKRPYSQSFLKAAELCLEVFCLVGIVCHVAEIVAMTVPAWKKAVSYYSGMVQNLSVKICMGWMLYRIVNTMITRSSRGLARKSDILGAETSRQESQVLAVGQTARVLVILGTLLSCLPVFQVDLGTVLSFCGMGGLAISLLSKGVFVNLIGSLTIYLTQPFTIGDWIQTVDGDVDGWVQSMGPYHTVVMRWDRRPLYIPNSRFMQVQIINANRMTNRRILLEIPVRISDLDKIDVVLVGIRDFIMDHKDLDTEQHRLVRLRDITTYAAVIWVSCYTIGIKLQDLVDAREDILLGIKNIMFKNGMSFATKLERQWNQVDQIGRVVQVPEGPAPVGQVPPGPSPVGAPTDFQGGGPPPLHAAPGDVEVLERPQQLVAAPQKQLLATELHTLKQRQEALWVRERDLKDREAEKEKEHEELQKQEELLLKRHNSIDEQTAKLEEALVDLASQEESLQNEEEDIDEQMDKLQKEEESLDHVMREMRTKSLAQSQQSAEGLLNEAIEDEVPRRTREDSVKEVLENFAEKQDQIAERKKGIEEERQRLKEQKAEIEELVEDEEERDKGKEGDEGEEEPVPEEERKLDEAARYKQIAESLGGE